MDKIILVQEEPLGPVILVEVPVTAALAGQSRISLPDVPQLRNTAEQIIIIKGIKWVTADALARAPIAGSVAAPLAEAQKISLVIYAEGWEKGQYLPLTMLNDVATPAGTIPFRFNPTKLSSWRNVDWNKTYLNYSSGTGGAAGVYTVMLLIDYVKYRTETMPNGVQVLKEIIGPSS